MEQSYAVNLDGTFHCTQQMLPGMVSAGTGKSLTCIPLRGQLWLFVNLVHYSASKAAIAGFTKSLAWRWRLTE
jgi:3-oxoacyl-[acyl-carrier protein] reductase